MHELAIIQNAVDMAIEQARLAGGARVCVMHLRIGELSGVVREALEFAFDSATQGTIAEGSRLEIEPVKAAAWCAVCGVEFACDDFLTECPRCGTVSAELRSGRELELSSLEIT